MYTPAYHLADLLMEERRRSPQQPESESRERRQFKPRFSDIERAVDKVIPQTGDFPVDHIDHTNC